MDQDDMGLHPKKPTAANKDRSAKHPKEPDGSEHPPTWGKRSYQDAEHDFIQVMSESKLEAFTYDPDAGKLYDVFDSEHAQILLDRYSDGRNPLYFIGVTNHRGGTDRWIHSKYVQVQGEDKIPFFGKWLDHNDNVFTDISYPINHGISKAEIDCIKRDNAQQKVLVIYTNGMTDMV
ncbi:MAG: hypothetical protein EB830_03240 [Nitrosopumilus sp. H13]|nr:MAG: hypothetical protein EB830_03240 [Nitrosopumilus sp. H13]